MTCLICALRAVNKLRSGLPAVQTDGEHRSVTGALISVSFLYIIPKSFELSPHAPMFLLGGFLLMHLFNRFITAFVCERGTHPAYGIGMVLHEFPEGIITYLLLLRGGFSEKIALLLAIIAASLSAPLGMLVSWPFISQIDKPLLGILLSLSAGALVYVAATHLLPQAEKEHRKYSLCALGAGILVAVLIVLSK